MSQHNPPCPSVSPASPVKRFHGAICLVAAACLASHAARPARAQSDNPDAERLAHARGFVQLRYGDALGAARGRVEELAGFVADPGAFISFAEKQAPRLIEELAVDIATRCSSEEIADMGAVQQSDRIQDIMTRVRTLDGDLVTRILRSAREQGLLDDKRDVPCSPCKLCTEALRGPLDTWAIHLLGMRPISYDTGKQPALGPLLTARTTPMAHKPDAAVDAYFQELHANADDGDEDSLLTLGCLDWLAEDFDSATNWLTRAAMRDSEGANFLLGYALYDGWGVPRDPESGVTFLTAAGSREMSEAQYKLGEIYLEPGNAVTNTEKGLRWMRRAADNGLARANRFLGNYLLTQPLTPERKGMAEKYLQRAAVMGSTNAFADLIAFYMTWGNSDKAVRWMKKQINRGDLNAYHQLAVKYLNTGRTKDACLWWQRGAEHGHRRSQLELARLYAVGKGVATNATLAEKWLIIADADEQERAKAYQAAGQPSSEEAAEAKKLAEEFRAQHDTKP